MRRVVLDKGAAADDGGDLRFGVGVWRTCAAVMVAERRHSAGERPDSDMRMNSRALAPWAKTPASVPKAMVWPISCS
jgi:hypothetical protein